MLIQGRRATKVLIDRQSSLHVFHLRRDCQKRKPLCTCHVPRALSLSLSLFVRVELSTACRLASGYRSRGICAACLEEGCNCSCSSSRRRKRKNNGTLSITCTRALDPPNHSYDSPSIIINTSSISARSRIRRRRFRCRRCRA